MESALAWIGQIAQWIGQWFPRFFTLDMTQGAVKTEGFFLPPWLRRFKGDVRVTVLRAGLHWQWPATTQVEIYPTEFQSDDLRTQTFETADGVPISVGGTISYRVKDLGLLLPRCHSAVKTVQVLTMIAIHATCCRLSYEALREEQRRGTLNTKLRNAARKPLEEFGVEVVDCMLTDLVRSRTFRLIQSTQVDDA